MLNFLTIVFSDIKALLTLRNNALENKVDNTKTKADEFSPISNKTLKSLGRFLKQFLVNFARIIPHNLHEEVFHVFELLLELLSTYR
jgi:hypothetical protein